jgi:glycosyltransferase involved in cell wall biosynthesis
MVAFLTPLYFDSASYVGGGERYALNLAIGVAEATEGRYRVEILSYGAEPFERELHEGVTLRVLRAARKPANPLDAVSWDLPDALAPADLVHLHMAFTRSGEFGLLAAKQQRKPVCVSDHGGWSSWLGQSVDHLQLADRLVAYSDFGARLLPRSAPVEVIKGGVDDQKFRPPLARPARDRVLYVGRLLPHKGIDRLIRALPDDLPLTVCGRPYHPDYFALLKKLAEGKRVEFVTDATDADILDLYARAWCNVLPSVYRDCYGQTYQAPELMGFTLLEAMACGTPAIASNVAAMPEFIQPGETGFVFDTEDELRSLLGGLAASPALADRIGRHAREEVEREYGLAVAGARLAAIYDHLIDGASAANQEDAA